MNPNQTSTSCEKSRSSRSLLQSLSLWELLLKFAIRRLRLHAHAFQVFVTSRTAAIILTLESSTRTYTAVVLMLVVAPLTSVSYQLFDKASKVTGWYYQSYFNLFYIISPYIGWIIFITGCFLLFPREMKRAWILSGPAALLLAKILWLITVTSNEEFFQMMPVFFIVLSFLITLVWLFTCNWVMEFHFHKREGCIARARGVRRLVKAQNIPKEHGWNLIDAELDKIETYSRAY
jgi:hypothetical protein